MAKLVCIDLVAASASVATTLSEFRCTFGRAKPEKPLACHSISWYKARSFVCMCTYKLLAAMQGCRWRRCCCELAKLAAAGAAAATVGSLCTAAANAADATNIATQWFWLAQRLRWLDLVNWLVRRLLGCLVGWPRSCVRLLPEYKQFVRQLRNGRFVVADKRVMARVAIFGEFMSSALMAFYSKIYKCKL